jgi:hypothetical protein
MAIPILTYHSMRIHGNEPETNDIVALRHDLRLLARRGVRVLPLAQIVEGLAGDARFADQVDVVGLSCDDGGDFDFHDIEHPIHGPQRSVLAVLREEGAISAHITSFVIVSPEARAELDRSCMAGRGWWTDGWWQSAVSSGHMHVANHSWDHNHDALPASFDHGVRRGTFASIDSFALAELEVAAARRFLQE